MPLAPGRLSMTMGCDQASVSFWPTARARMSVVPPGENGTTTRTGLVGHAAWANNAVGSALPARARTWRRLTKCMLVLLQCGSSPQCVTDATSRPGDLPGNRAHTL